MYKPIADLAAPLSAADVRVDECPAGRIVAQVLLEAGRRNGEWVHGAFINGGNIRGDLVGLANQVRPVDLLGVVPYRNKVHVISGPPELLFKVLANSVVCRKLDPAGFLQTAGIRWRCNDAGRLQDVRVEVQGTSTTEWAPASSLAEVHLATIDWLLDGGHGYRGLVSGNRSTDKTIEEHWQLQLEPGPEGHTKAITAPSDTQVDFHDNFRCLTPEAIVKAAEADFGGRLNWARTRLGMA